MQKAKETIVVKIGGSTLNSDNTTIDDLVSLQKRGLSLVVVHGGAQEVSHWLTRLGISTNFIRGLRVTDAKTLEVVTAILAGLVNKELVAAIETHGGKAVGLSGVDGALIQSEIKNPELGYAGKVVKVDITPLEVLMEAGYIPVISPVSLGLAKEPILNVNGDTVAGELAAALSANRLIFLTDTEGICDSSGKVVARLNSVEAKELLASGVASGGMIPKIESCLRALSTVPVTRIIDGRLPHALIVEIEGMVGGTTLAR